MLVNILAVAIVGLLGVLVGMIIESALENRRTEEVQVIEINDHRTEEESQDFFEPF